MASRRHSRRRNQHDRNPVADDRPITPLISSNDGAYRPISSFRCNRKGSTRASHSGEELATCEKGSRYATVLNEEKKPEAEEGDSRARITDVSYVIQRILTHSCGHSCHEEGFGKTDYALPGQRAQPQ